MISVLLKKILIKYKIIYAALFLLVVFCVYLSCKGNYSISVKGVEKKYEETFDSLFAGYEGKWTAQKEARLEQMTDKQDALDEQFSQLSYDLLNKKKQRTNCISLSGSTKNLAQNTMPVTRNFFQKWIMFRKIRTNDI